MNIISKRLELIEISKTDLKSIHRLFSIPEVDEFNTLGIPKNENATFEIIKPDIEDQFKNPRSRFCWKVLEKETGKFVGLTGMFLSNDKFKMAEFYYKYFPEFWGKGFATETAKALINFGFTKYNLHRIEAGVATENKASIRVLEKAGMTCEGIRRKILPIRGKWIDNLHYAIVEDDFFIQKNNFAL